MVNWLYNNWAKLSVLLAIVLTTYIIIFIKPENILLFFDLDTNTYLFIASV